VRVAGRDGTAATVAANAEGTAFDIAGRNRASASSMKSAILTAIQMARVRRNCRLATAAAGRSQEGEV